MSKVLVVMLVLGVVLISACSGTGATLGTVTTEAMTASTEAETTTTEVETTTTALGDIGTRENPIPVGEAAVVGDWTVKVTGCTPDATQAVLDVNQFNDPPAAGAQYVLVHLSASYRGDESATFWTSMSYKFLGSAGNTFGSAMAVSPKSITDEGETFPGATISGDLLFEVESTQIAGGLLILESSFSFDDDRVFFAIE